MSNGRFAMSIIASFIRDMPRNYSSHQFCVGVTAAIRKHYIPFWKRNKDEVISRLHEHPEERLTASAAIFSRMRREVWLVGDCQCLIGGQLYENPKPYEQQLAEQRAAAIRRLTAEGVTASSLLTDDVARRSVIPRMLQEMRNQNVTYAVIDGFPIPEQKVPVITLDFQPWEIVLATDGYPFLCPTLAESESRLQQQKEQDPLNIDTFKATKGFMTGNDSFDDRTFIRFQA